MNERELISAKALELFMRFGIRSVSMDDLAKQLGISKKTLYKHFNTKDDLVWSSMELEEQHHRLKCEEIFKPRNNAIEEMVEIGLYINEHLKTINPGMIYDLKKYHRDCWDQFMQRHRSGIFFETLCNNLEKGKKQGLYRSDFDEKLVATFYLARMNSLFDSDAFTSSNYQLNELYFESLKYHVYGICTSKGTRYFEKMLLTLKDRHYAA